MKRGDPITARTRVGELLDAHPELEEVLVGLSPSYRKLRNPVLRRTVARVATLASVAPVGDLEPVELVALLRREVGQPAPEPGDGAGGGEADPVAGEVTSRHDVDAMLERGEHPLAVVRTQLRELPEGGVIELTASFVPGPLIEELREQGWAVAARTDHGRTTVRIGRPS